jgi:hypothetical protein
VRQETIAADLERSRAWVHAAIAELEEQGLLLHDRQYIEGRQRASRYRLQDGVARRRSDDAESEAQEVSEQADAAVKPADTSHHDESKDSFSGFARESAELVPADWVPTVDDMAWARSRHPNLDILAFTETFVLSCQAKGYRYADPSAAWRRWLIEPKGKLPQLTAPTTSDQESAHEDRTAKPRNRGSANPSTPSGGSLADANHRRAAACLDRLMGRRTGDPSAGHAG